MININNLEQKQFITDDPMKLMNYIQEYQTKIRFLIASGKINMNNVIFSDIGIAK